MKIGLPGFDPEIIRVFLSKSELFWFVGFNGEVVPSEYDPHAIRFESGLRDQWLG